MAYIIAQPCIDVMDRACVEVCPVDCIYEPDATTLATEDRRPMLYIHPEECIDCGLCIDACPVQAIFPLEEVPDQWAEWIAKNYEHFDMEAP